MRFELDKDGSRTGTGPDPAPRFRNPCTLHDAAYKLTEADRAAAAKGAIYILGNTLAKVQHVCRLLGSDEGIWYYLARDPEPVIQDIHIPKQRVSAISVDVTPDDVIRSSREIRRGGYSVRAGGHSHGHMEVFCSSIDRTQEQSLLEEGVVRISTVTERIEAPLQETRASDGSPALRASLPGGSVTAEISGLDAKPAGLNLAFVVTRKRARASFSTSNVKGEHLWPALETVMCPICGGKEERDVPASAIPVHVIGPVSISEEEKQNLRAELDSKVVRGWGYGRGSDWDWRACRRWLPTPGYDDDPAASTPSTSWEPACHIYHRGQYMACISLAVLEEAAAKTPSLRAALGWDAAGEDSEQGTP